MEQYQKLISVTMYTVNRISPYKIKNEMKGNSYLLYYH